MIRYFLFQDVNSQKFWNMETQDTKLTVRYGRVGTTGQVNEKAFDTPEQCEAEAKKMIAQKIKKGYIETSADGVQNAKDEAKRFSYTWEEWDDGKENENLFHQIENYKGLSDLRHMTIANWCGFYEGESCQEIIDWIIERSGQFTNLETLRLGDIDQEECELSWIEQGNYSALWLALPNLRNLIIQGGTGLELGEIVHENLESIEIISGGLPKTVIHSIAMAKTPCLKKFNLYIGVDSYGFDGGIEDIKELLNDSSFPQLSYLGICNSEFADEIVSSVLACQYASQIETLDLSKSVFTNKGAQRVIDGADQLSSLKLLDLGYHYVEGEMMEKLKKLPFKVNLSDPQKYDEEESYYNQPMFTE